ncbi:MAG: sensor histidine kinase [Anaerolineae bacterium]
MLDPALLQNLALSEEEQALLKTVEQQMCIVADLSRADLLLYARKGRNEFVILAHAQPHSLAHVYNYGRAGTVISTSHRPEIVQTLANGRVHKDQRSIIAEGAPVVRETLPIYYPPAPPPVPRDQANHPSPAEAGKRRVIAALVIVTNLIEHERHKFRSELYRRELRKLQAMLLGGLVTGAESLSPFGEQDGILFVDGEGIIQYTSGIAANLYRRVGYIDTLVGRQLKELDTNEDDLRKDALAQMCCLEQEAREGDRYWVRKVIPVLNYTPAHYTWFQRLLQIRLPKISGVLIVLHDDTEIRRQDEELRIKNAMIQEVHHRVKNNLQTIAGLLRMQARRVKSEEAKVALDEALNRILSVAVIHEFLSSKGSNIINIKEVCSRIVAQFQAGMLSPDKQISFSLSGDPIFLPARQATACSLIINELMQNSLEHGFEGRQQGSITVNLADNGEEVIISVSDDGTGIPAGFTLDQAKSLGLQIVRILVEDDLKGVINLHRNLDNGDGLRVEIIFRKTNFEGEEGWKEHVSS